MPALYLHLQSLVLHLQPLSVLRLIPFALMSPQAATQAASKIMVEQQYHQEELQRLEAKLIVADQEAAALTRGLQADEASRMMVV